MRKIRIVNRVIVYDDRIKRVLLVRNRGQDFWYPPGGGWEYEAEHIMGGAKREVKEETGLDVDIIRLLYVQEFHDKPDSISFEIFWLAKPSEVADLKKVGLQKNDDGQVKNVRWFNEKEMRDIKVFPERLQSAFWKNINNALTQENPFLEA